LTRAQHDTKGSRSCRHEARTRPWLGLTSGPPCQARHDSIGPARVGLIGGLCSPWWLAKYGTAQQRPKPNPKASVLVPHTVMPLTRNRAAACPCLVGSSTHAAAPLPPHCVVLTSSLLSFLCHSILLLPFSAMSHPSLPCPLATNIGAQSPLASSPRSREGGLIRRWDVWRSLIRRQEMTASMLTAATIGGAEDGDAPDRRRTRDWGFCLFFIFFAVRRWQKKCSRNQAGPTR
jgi:hypothetical protein